MISRCQQQALPSAWTIHHKHYPCHQVNDGGLYLYFLFSFEPSITLSPLYGFCQGLRFGFHPTVSTNLATPAGPKSARLKCEGR